MKNNNGQSIWRSKKVWSWAFYDWANSVFATVVIAGFFPIVFKQYYASHLSVEESSFWLGSANSLSSLIIVFVAPFVGSIADCAGARKKMLIMFMLLGVAASFLLSPIITQEWLWVLLFYVLASIGFMGANIFYDALIVNLGYNNKLDQISGLGYGLGYLGGGILLAACVWISQHAQQLGFNNTIDAVLLSFILVAMWWLIFSLPLALWLEESKPLSANASMSAQTIFSVTLQTFKSILSDKSVAYFLLAYWIYIDGVDTIIRMAVDYGLALGFDSSDLILALLITQFVGFPAAILYGYLGNKLGIKNTILFGLVVYVVICIIAYDMQSAKEFYVLAVMIGLVQGGIQALSRSYFAQLIPQEKSAEYFGVYNMMGKSAAIIGPLLMGAVSWLSGDSRISILAILPMFIVGGLLLTKVTTRRLVA